MTNKLSGNINTHYDYHTYSNKFQNNITSNHIYMNEVNKKYSHNSFYNNYNSYGKYQDNYNNKPQNIYKNITKNKGIEQIIPLYTTAPFPYNVSPKLCITQDFLLDAKEYCKQQSNETKCYIDICKRTYNNNPKCYAIKSYNIENIHPMCF